MTKHTPGPWKWVGTKGNPNSRQYLSAPDGYVLYHDSSETETANATLIAASPELLEALQQIIDINGSTGGAKALVAEFKHIAAQAIAKATT